MKLYYTMIGQIQVSKLKLAQKKISIKSFLSNKKVDCTKTIKLFKVQRVLFFNTIKNALHIEPQSQLFASLVLRPFAKVPKIFGVSFLET